MTGKYRICKNANEVMLGDKYLGILGHPSNKREARRVLDIRFNKDWVILKLDDVSTHTMHSDRRVLVEVLA